MSKNEKLTLEQLEKLKSHYLKQDWSKGIPIQVMNYSDLYGKVDSLISVCQSALAYLGENRNAKLNDWEHSKLYYSTPLDVVEVLDITRDLMHESGIELLDQLQK